MLVCTLNYLPKKAQGEMASDAALSIQLVQRIDYFASLVRMDDVKLSSYGCNRNRRGGKNTQKNCTKKILINQITSMV